MYKKRKGMKLSPLVYKKTCICDSIELYHYIDTRYLYVEAFHLCTVQVSAHPRYSNAMLTFPMQFKKSNHSLTHVIYK